MPQLIMMKGTPTIDGSAKRAVQSFFEKLTRDDTTPGLNIEPIIGSLDPRARTGRVDGFYRAVLIRLQGGQDATYVYAGTFAHDDAIAYAKRVRLTRNPINGLPELEEMVAPRADRAPAASVAPAAPEPVASPPGPPARVSAPPPTGGSRPAYAVLGSHTLADLTGAGVREDIAAAALALVTEDALLDFAADLRPAWQGALLVALACGEGLEEALAGLGLIETGDEDEGLDEEENTEEPAVAAAPRGEDDELLEAMRRPAAGLDFAIVEPTEEGMAEFFEVLDGGTFAQWRVFLHPQQRAYASRSRNGAFRLSGGAGTGKTVVLLHRARALHAKDPAARIVLTTYNRTLAQSLAEGLELLDGGVPQVDIGAAGVAVAGIDAFVRRVLADAGQAVGEPGPGGVSPVARILGERTSSIMGITRDRAWQSAIDGVAQVPEVVTPQLLEAEYSLVVLPNRITTEDDYLRVRRPGRGVRLGRSQRRAVWSVIAAYRAQAAAEGTTDWDEKAMIAAAHLDDRLAQGWERPADHVLVDEAQDLTPARLRFLRSLVSEGRNDLFLAEDAHQRIYAPKVVLSHVGINIRGRSRRLTLNYRTTAQNLGYAVRVLEGADFTDMSGEAVSTHGYRSARPGVPPILAGYGSASEEYDGVAARIAEWTSASGAAGGAPTIGLLCASKWRGQAWVRELADRAIKATFVGADRNPPAPGTGADVTVMTLHRAKGMEFSKVIITGMNAHDAFSARPGQEDDAADEALRQRSLLYVASTRARDELAITWVGEPHELLRARHSTENKDMREA
ncbi:AAA family ATPase [Pseudactinotalea sp. HY160]|uniref:UvrD-helicase domain-containing protein n=1 Tax=Pseudactinotalea sp. HY160 TaxID=2654490 RepID=UPI00128D5379|nr:UvrD-helicase domain-containing protein [Pseudactinotalea sp. HY160]MPV50983.1 AAA family ATPase [Pseudactinotalea sp. HY160]